MTKEKRCPRCGILYTRSLANFHRHRARSDGLQDYCRHGCQQAAVKRSLRRRRRAPVKA